MSDKWPELDKYQFERDAFSLVFADLQRSVTTELKTYAPRLPGRAIVEFRMKEIQLDLPAFLRFQLHLYSLTRL